MRLRLLILFLSGALLVAAEGKVTTQLAGYSLVRDTLEKEYGEKKMMNGLSPLRLSVVCQSSGKKIVALGDESAQSVEIRDDMGKDLRGEIWPFADFSKDKKTVLFEVQGKEALSQGAKKIMVKGEGLVVLAETSEKKSSPLVAAKKGEAVKVSEKYQFKIAKARKPKWGDAQWEVEFHFNFDRAELKGLSFIDAKGKEIEAESAGRGYMGMAGKLTYTTSYKFKKKIDEFTVVAEIWTDLEKVKVPLNFEIPIGE